MSGVAQKVEIVFTDDHITSSSGNIFLSHAASLLDHPALLDSALGLKVRKRPASDAEMILSLIYCWANGDGSRSDVDRLRADQARREVLGLENVPGHPRRGEDLCRFDEAALDRFYQAARSAAEQAAPAVIERELSEKGYILVFMEGS